MDKAEQLVKSTIQSHDLVVFSKTWCTFCQGVKRLFDKEKLTYFPVELDKIEHGKEVQDFLGKMTGASTVPRVFVKGRFIGGHDDTMRLYKSGEFQKYMSMPRENPAPQHSCIIV